MIKKQIYEILNEIAEDIDITDETLLLDEGILDSVSILYLVSELEDKNGIHIPVEEISEEHLKTVSDIEKFVKSKLGD